jgi:cobalt-zinc-cadmium efflux system membrane fusion protein
MNRLPLVAVTVALAIAACKHDPGVFSGAPVATSNEVLLTKDQVAQMKIVTQRVALQDVDDTVLVAGKVSFTDQKVFHVFSPVTGKATNVLVQQGSHVKKGDVLATIESPDIGNATSDVGKAQAALQAAEVDFERQKELRKLNANSQKDYEAAASTYGNAKAELERAEQKAALFHRGDVTGQTYTLRADGDGEVFFKAVSPGMEISGQYTGSAPQEIFTIGNADTVWVLSDVYETDIARIKVGQDVVVNLPAYKGRDFTGKVDWVAQALDPTTHATKVRSTFVNTDFALKPEMFGTVKISVDVKQALAIPRAAVVRLGDQLVVFLDRGAGAEGNERFERLPVIVDEGEGSKWLTVDHGLNVGDQIVTSGVLLLSEEFQQHAG